MSILFRCIAALSFVTGWLNLAGAAPAFPVQYSANGRYLVGQNGVPFPIMGRTAWFVTSLSATDQHTFVDDTVTRGYDAIELHVINHDPRGNHPPFNGAGNTPFVNRLNGTSWDGSLSYGNINSEAPDFTTPNQAYWNSVDALLAYCEANGVLVLMFPAYVGWMGGEQGWMREMVANGPTKMQSYGAWIANRYRDQKNLIWMMGGDMGTSPNTFSAEQTAVEGALLTGLQSISGQQSTLFSAEWNTDSIATDQTDFGTAMSLNGAYSHGGDVNTQGRRAYMHNPAEPSFLLEGPYDQEGSDGNNWNPSATQPVRRFEWWSWLSATGGYVLGNGYVWPFNSPDWQNHLNTTCTHDMTRLNSFMTSVPWFNLVPSGLGGMQTLITAGNSSVSSSSYVAAAATLEGNLLVAYIPPDHSGSITVDMTAMNGPSHARWFDPTNAAYIEIGSGLPNTGNRVFNPTGNNSAGEDDWTLIIETQTVQTPTPPPSPTPTASPQQTVSPTATATPTVSPQPTVSPTATPTLTPSFSPTATATPTVSPQPTVSPTSTPTLTPVPAAQALNLSTRMKIQTGDNVGIGGFVLLGTGSKHVLVRALGPSLTQVGVPNALTDPVLELHGPDSFVTMTNDNWRDNQEAEIIADGIPPTNNQEAAIDANLASGAYTAVVRGKDGAVGVGLVEIYDLSPIDPPRLLNISTRAFVNSGNEIVIAGFILGMQDADGRIVVRGIGPSLTAFGVPDALSDPTLELRDANGGLLASDDNWEDDPSQAAELIAAGLAPGNSLESGIAATLSPGSYTALLAGAGNNTGVGLVEVYDRGSGP